MLHQHDEAFPSERAIRGKGYETRREFKKPRFLPLHKPKAKIRWFQCVPTDEGPEDPNDGIRVFPTGREAPRAKNDDSAKEAACASVVLTPNDEKL